MKIDLRGESRVKKTIHPILRTEDDSDVQVIKRALLERDGRYKMRLKDLELSVLDFGNTIDGTHKGIKSEHANDFLYQHGYDVGLIMTAGNAGPSMHRVSEDPKYQSSHQIIQCMEREKLEDLIVIDRMSSKIPRIQVGLPNQWFKSGNWFRNDQLEKFWKELIQEKISDYKNGNLNWMINYFKTKGLDPTKVCNVSNISDFSNDVPYFTESIENAVIDNSLVIVGLGIGELGRGVQEARLGNEGFWKRVSNYGFWKAFLGKGPANILYVTSKAHPIGGNKKKKSSARKLDMQKMSKDCKAIKDQADEDTYFSPVPSSAINHTYGTLRNLRDEGELNMRTSTSGCIGLSVLDMARPDYGKLVIPGTYAFEQHPQRIFSKEQVDYDLVIKPGEKICIINTGGSVD